MAHAAQNHSRELSATPGTTPRTSTSSPVRNVLVRDGHLEPRLSRPSRTDDARPAPRSGDRPEQVRVVVGPAGRVVIPAAYREVLGIDEGDTVVMRIEGDELHLISDATEVRQQAPAPRLVRTSRAGHSTTAVSPAGSS